MKILLNLILQFIFIYLALIIGIPGLNEDNIFKSKMILFIGIVIFQIFIKSSIKLKFKCKFSIKKTLTESLFIGILAVFGYSFYLDMTNMNYTKDILESLEVNEYIPPFIISFIINFCILAILLFQMLFNIQIDKCEKYKEIYNF